MNGTNMDNARILVVDDQLAARELYRSYLADYAVDLTSNALEALKMAEKEEYDLFITDLIMPGMDGIEFIRKLRKMKPDAGVIVISQTEEIDLAIQAFREQALEFLRKPIRKSLLLNHISRTLEFLGNRRRLKSLSLDSSRDMHCPEPVIGEGELMVAFWADVRKTAESSMQFPVLITGETGSGKEIVARQLHRWSDRRNKPFIAVNCGLLSASLAASELFGVMKGIATGVDSRDGKFKVADKGTLFLDEVAELPSEVQSMLLRAFQDKIIIPVGSHKEISVDVKIIAATNKNIGDKVKENLFREDLFYRLNVVTLNVPPLRKHTEDIPELLVQLYQRHGGEGLLPMSGEEIESWTQYHWPGNIRQLETVLINRLISEKPVRPEMFSGTSSPMDSIDELIREQSWEAIKRNVFQRVLEKTDGNFRKAAKMLGIPKSTLWEFCRKHELTEPRDKDTR